MATPPYVRRDESIPDMRLSTVLADVDLLGLDGDPAIDVTDVTFAADRVAPGALFCCLPGRNVDGHVFAGQAAAAGAVALLVERAVDVDLPQARVREARAAMAAASAALYQHPSRALTTVGVTGTNGKSTTVHLLKAILDATGRPCGSIGTMNNARTTPEAPDLQRLLAGFRDEGLTAAALEVSSVGLAQHRVDGTSFAAAVFTNLSPDELWIHGSMEEYFEAKSRLFDRSFTPLAIVNTDDEWGTRLVHDARERGVEVVPVSVDDAADVRLLVGRSTFRWRGHEVELDLDGVYNVANAVAALATCSALGIDEADAAAALASLSPLAGHGEDVVAGQPFRVVVDFAHTAGAMTATLDAARATTTPPARVIVVFGCGGDRDPGRRQPMGEAAGSAADLVIVTSDNPRTEDPMAIIDSVVEGARRGSAELAVEPDRRRAIAMAIESARPGDVVVVAGKGHETGQTIGTETFPFDDRQVVRDVLEGLGGRR